MAISNNIEDPKYRKKIYDFLSTNFADFKRTEADFYKKLDTDSNYAGQVYDVISQNYSDFGRPRAEFLELMLPSKKKELSEVASPVGGGAGISAPPSDSGKGFGGLKPAERQPAEVIKEPKVVGEDTLLTRKMEQAQRPAVATTEVKLPTAPKVVAEERAAERALVPKLPTAPKEDIGELEGLSNAIDRGVLQGKLADMLALGQMPKREDIKEIARINKELTQIPSTGAYQRFNAATDLKTAAKEFVDNPFEITSQLISESLSALVRHGYSRALAGAGTGAALGSLIPIPGISTAAGAGTGYIAGMGVAGYNLEMASSIMDSFREAGVDVTDEKSLTKAFDDPNTLKKAREFANKRAVPIAIFDMFSAGMGGKLLGKPAKTILGKVGRGAAEVGIQMGMAGAGETAAQLTAGQKINPTAILAEVIGEAGGGAPDIIVGTMIENKKNNQSIRKDAVRLDIKPEELQDMLDISEASGEITDAQANEIKKEYEDIQKVKQAVPEEFKKNADVIEALEQKRQLEAKKQGLDPVFAKKIDDQIKALDTKIDDIVAAGEVAPEMVQYTMEAPRLAGEPEQISKPIELSIEPQVPAAPAKAPITTIEVEEAARQMQPITDRMVQIEREFENLGYKIDTDYDNEMIVSDIEGNEVGEIPESLVPLAAEYEKATRRLGEFDDRARERALSKSREVVEAEAVEVKPELPAAPAKSRVQDAIDKYDEGEISTINDLVDEIEAIADEEGNQVVLDAVEEYREEQRYNESLKGRGDMDAAEDAFLSKIRGVGEVAPEAAPSYLQNVRQTEAEGFYKADFGRNGGLTWEIPESQREKDSPEYLIVQSIDRNKDTGEAPKEDSKGEGAKAIADLFNKYPSVNEIVYDDYSQSGFWQKIGGDNQSLKREDFFKYYNSKFPKEAVPEVPAAPEIGSLRGVELSMRRPDKNEVIFVPIDALLQKHAKDQPSYDIQKPENRIKGRVEKAKEFIKNYIKDQRAIDPKTGERMKTKVSFEPSVLDIDENGKISFEDGRHRVLAAKELGLTEVPIEVPKEKVKAVEDLLVGEVAPETAPQVPAAPVESGAGVSIQKQSDYVQEILGVSSEDADAMSLIHNADLTANEKNILWRQWKQGVMSMGDIKKYTSLDLGAISQGRIDKWANAILTNKKKGEKIGEDIEFEEIGEAAPEVPAAPEIGADIQNKTESKILLPVDEINNLRQQSKTDLATGRAIELEKKLSKEGIKEPLVISYYPNEGKAVLTDGHNRLDVATDMGAKNLPIRIVELYGDAPSNAKDWNPPKSYFEGVGEVAPEAAPELPAAPEKTQDEVAKEQTKETDLLLGGQAEQRRKDGKYTKDGVEYVRNPKGQGIASEVTGEVRFTNEVSLPFKYKLVEAETLQPSHQDGIRNPLHFIPEAQPKNRNDVGSLQAEESFANNPRFSELGENTNAYSGAPVVNERGEVVQGNNRSAGLRKGYQRNNPQYKNDLAANAEQFGFTREQVERMKNPVLVREVAVSDQGAVELGNYDAKDLETGGKRRIDPIAVTRRMPFDVKGRISDLFTGEETLNQAIRANQKRLLELLNPYLNQAQRNTITKDGVLTDAGIKDLEAVVQQFLFDNGDTALPDLFESLSATQKEGLRKSLPYVFSVSPEKSLVPDIQEAILAVNDFNASGAGEFDAWLLQGDIFNDGKTPKDKYTPLELAIAKTLVESKTQKEVARKFADYADVVKDKEADMFEAARPGKSRKEGVLEIFKAEDYAKPISERGRKEAAPEKKPTPEPSAEKRPREAKREPRLPETEKRAEARKELRDAFNDLMNLGVAYDPRSQAEKQVRLTRAIINVIKQEAIGAIKDLKKYIKDNVGFDISDNDAKYLLIESKKPEYAIQEPTAGKVPVQPKARAGEKVEAGVPPTRPPKPPKEGEVEGETGAEKKSVELSLKGIKEIANEFSIEDVEGRTRKTDIELRENAKDKIDKWVAEGSYDKNIDNLVKKAEDFDVLTDEQRIILEQHLANVRENFSNGIENGTIKAGSEEFINGLNQIKRLLDAASKTRSAAGAALRIPIGGSVAHPLENYDTALVAKMDANSVDKLTDAQIKEVEESVRLYKEKIDAANERIKDLEDKLSQMMAEEEVNSVKKRKKAIKSKEERVAERKQAIADAREALKKIRTGEAGLSAVPIPFVREFVAISPYVKKIAQSYIEEGVDNLNLLIDKIYEDFKDDLPEMTKKDVRDIIGNQYSQRKETITEAKSKLRDFTEEARLLSLYEKLLSGEEPVSERKKIERNQRIVELRDKINEIRRRNKEQDVDYRDLKRIEDTKNRALQKAKEYKKRLDEKDFAPSEKPISIFNDTKLQKKYPKEYNEMLDAIQEREDAKHEFDIELIKDEERRQTKLQKIGRYAKMFTGTTKAIKSGIDASATLIQNFAMLSAYPKSYFKAFVNQWGDAASQKKFNRWHTAIKNNKPVWDLIQNSGLSITEPSALKEAQKEEIFSDNILDRTFKIGDKTYNIGKYTTKPFERLFVSMGNALRVDVFLRIADKWYTEGKTFETNPEDYKSLANMLNNMTSRSKLAPAVERARDIVGTGIWSPQLMASRLNLLGISDVTMPFFGRKGYYAGLTPKVRKMQIANMAKMIGLGLSIMLLAKVSGSDDDEGDLDPVSPTFGTVKVGEKRIPVWSNYIKYIRTIAQFASGKQKIEGEYVDKRRGETILKFFRSSVPPATGTAIDIITGRDYMGKPITKEGIVKGLVMPMSLEAISKEVKRDGALGAVTGVAQFFGLNISDERDYVKKDDRPFDIKDPVTFKKREVTEKELEVFKKRRDEIYKELSDDYENGRKTIYLNPEDKIKLSIPSSLSDTELDSWRELYYEKLTPEQIKELYKLLMSKAKKDSKNELKLTLGEEEEKED